MRTGRDHAPEQFEASVQANDVPMNVPISRDLWMGQAAHHQEQADSWREEIQRLENELNYANACFRVNTVAAEKAHEMADLVESNLENHEKYVHRNDLVKGESVPSHLLRG